MPIYPDFCYSFANMLRRTALLFLLFLPTTLPAYAKPEAWLQVKSQHFVVISNSGERDAKHVADQFERMRGVFHVAFPAMQLDPASPIIVIAVKNQKDFRELEPSQYLAKGMLQLAGLFLPAPDKNYVLLRLDVPDDEHPYATVYHEYTHLLCSKAADWLPLWLNEGLAQFYENTDIRGKDISSGEPSAVNIQLLRQNRLLPLPVLFSVDHNSPYYHEENKGSIFYAESWALTHYFEIQDQKNGTHHLADYLQLVAGNVDPVTAGTRAFGDLDKLQKTLDAYIGQGSFMHFVVKAPIDVDDSTFVITPLETSQADAVRADFLAYNSRESDSRALVEQVLKDAPNTALAHETLGYLEFRQGHLEEARKAYQEAIRLNSQSYLANYYFAAISIRGGPPDPASAPAIESSFRNAIKLNPQFAPSYDGLATFYGMQRKNLDDAHMLAVTAVQIEPEVAEYRVTAGNILMEMGQISNAIIVYKNAVKLAKTPEESEQVQNALQNAEQFQAMSERYARGPSTSPSSSTTTDAAEITDSAPALVRATKVHPLNGPKHEAKGILKNVRCASPAILEFTLEAQGHSLPLHSDNYYNIDFTALGFTPQGELHPCTDIENLHARVQFVDSDVKDEPGQVVGVELTK